MPDRTERIVFSLSISILAVAYGVLACQANMFPMPLIEKAVAQADHWFGNPEFLYPKVYAWEGVRQSSGKNTQPGLTLLTSRWKNEEWEPGLKLIDRNGKTAHYWRIDTRALVPDDHDKPGPSYRPLKEQSVHGTHVFPNGDVILNIGYSGPIRIDACGKVKWRVFAGGHHSIDQASDGTLWLPGIHPEPRRSTPQHPQGLPGIERPVFQELIVNVSPTGEKLASKNLFDILYENDLARYIFRHLPAADEDVLHLNDVEPLPQAYAGEYDRFDTGDLLVSIRNLHLVLVVDPESWQVLWHASSPFSYQHDPDYIGDGWIGVFDNNSEPTPRGQIAGGSRVVALQPDSDSVKVLFDGRSSVPFYTENMGKWQQLENGNLLLTESEAGHALEVTPEGERVWEWVHRDFQGKYVPELTEATRYPFSTEAVGSWPCSVSRTEANARSRKNEDSR